MAEGTTELSNRWNPQVGDVVSFKHRGFLLATKRPKIPTLYRLRPDLTWQDVLDNWKEHKSISHGTLKSSPPPLPFPNNGPLYLCLLIINNNLTSGRETIEAKQSSY